MSEKQPEQENESFFSYITGVFKGVLENLQNVVGISNDAKSEEEPHPSAEPKQTEENPAEPKQTEENPAEPVQAGGKNKKTKRKRKQKTNSKPNKGNNTRRRRKSKRKNGGKT